MKKLVGLILLFCYGLAYSQVDTSFIYNATMPYGTLDIRIAKSSTRYYYLQENVTYSFRESSPGVKTNTYKDLTSWNSSPYAEGNMKERNGSSHNFVMNYRLLFPANYNPSYTNGYPLIVMVHGLGERGNCWDTNCYWADKLYKPSVNSPAAPTTPTHDLLNNDHNLVHGGLPHLTARNLSAGKYPDDPTLDPRAFPGFVLFAQNLNGWDTNAIHDYIRLVRLALKKYNIDPDRVYIHGLSNGGAGVYDAIKRAPWLFAAALPMSAINDASIHSKFLAPTVAHIPVWTFQGGQDTNPLPSKTELTVKKFREAGMDIKYTLYPNLGHGVWNTAYDEPDFFSWMLNKNKSKLHVFYNIPKVCPTNGQGAKMGYAAGFLAYQWEKDGVVIDSATSNEYVATQAGVYRARFSRKANPAESDWNQWSQPVTITVSEPLKPGVDVYGTRFMRGPDNNSAQNTIQLKSSSPNDKYYWYKNGVLINIPNTSLDDSTRTYKITATSSSYNGAYTLVTKGFDNCPSPSSDSIKIYFANSGPYMADTEKPTSFTGVATSPSEVDLFWVDKSTIETEYEIWRRKPGDIFQLAGKTSANATYFHDSGIHPGVAYQYKIRAVNATSRSNYSPSNSTSTNLIVTTLPDLIAPTTPSGLVVTANSISTISLRWTASTDNTSIRQYHIHYGDSVKATVTPVTQYTLTGLPMNVAYNITVVAEDWGGNFSTPSNAVTGSTYVTGLVYGHSTGAWSDLDQITNWGTPEFTGTVTNFTLTPRTQEDYFNFEFKGYLYIQTGGIYQFSTTSDDGSRITLNNLVIVDNDGLHGDVTVNSANQTLTSGPQEINVKFFEYTGGQSLTVRYKGPDTGNNWVTIPASALRTGDAPPTPTSLAAKSGAGNARQISPAPEEGVSEIITVNVFPNPSSADNIHLRVETSVNLPVQVRMLDMVGKAHFYQVFTPQDLQVGTQIRPSGNLLNGMYIIQIEQGNRRLVQKIAINN
jgi:hypothetical protein